MKCERNGFKMRISVLGLGVALCLAASPEGAWACQGPPPDCGPTTWQAGESSWYIAGNWSAGVPSNCKTARVDNAGTALFSSGRAKAKALELGVTVVGRGTVVLSPNAELRIEAGEYVGLAGYGQFVQAGGSHFVSCGTLTVGDKAGSYGDYYLDSGLLSAKNVIVADAGVGTFIQASGLHKVTCGDLVVAGRHVG